MLSDSHDEYKYKLGCNIRKIVHRSLEAKTSSKIRNFGMHFNRFLLLQMFLTSLRITVPMSSLRPESRLSMV